MKRIGILGLLAPLTLSLLFNACRHDPESILDKKFTSDNVFELTKNIYDVFPSTTQAYYAHGSIIYKGRISGENSDSRFPLYRTKGTVYYYVAPSKLVQGTLIRDVIAKPGNNDDVLTAQFFSDQQLVDKENPEIQTAKDSLQTPSF